MSNTTTIQITKKEVEKVAESPFSETQLNFILGATPKQYIRTRQGKGGQQWEYVSTAYIIKRLNLLFGWRWSFKIDRQDIIGEQVVVQGTLTFKVGGEEYSKTQFGRKDIALKKETKTYLDIGNDCKAAASDSLKKCASMIGIAQDIYGKEDFRDVEVMPTQKENEEELTRIVSHIATSQTVEELNQVEDVIESEFVRNVFNAKLKQLSK